jgi:predicted nuclease with TOPRIM domain
MQNLQEVFNRIKATKKEQKEIRKAYKDSLSASQSYKETVEKISGHKLRKKQIEEETKKELGQEYVKLESLKKDIDLDKEMLTDIAISTLMKGETVELADEDGNVYEPIFSVKFKKTNQITQAK